MKVLFVGGPMHGQFKGVPDPMPRFLYVPVILPFSAVYTEDTPLYTEMPVAEYGLTRLGGESVYALTGVS